MRVIATVVAMMLIGVALPAVAVAADLAQIDSARNAALGSDFQPTLPVPGDNGSASARPRPGAEDAERPPEMFDTRSQDRNQRAGPVAALFNFILWGVVIVGAVLAAVWLGRELVKYAGDAPVPGGDVLVTLAASDAAIIDRPLGDADELARQGQFAEAIHTLLLRTLQALAKSAAVRVAPASTSREILARMPLLADARDALAGLITAVEITHFGSEPATAADYDRCRQQFHVFVAAFRASNLQAAA